MLQTNVSTYETTGIYDDQLIDQKYQNILTNNLTVEQKTTYMVDVLKAELNEQKLIFIRKKIKVRDLIKNVQEEMEKANNYLQGAQVALSKLNKKNLTRLRKLGKFGKWRVRPIPTAVAKAVAAVIVLLSKHDSIIPRDNSWKAFKMLMIKDNVFLNSLTNFDKNHIHPDIIRVIRPYLNDQEFDPNYIAQKSVAAACLCTWVINIAKFNTVWQIIELKATARDHELEELSATKNQITKLKKMIKEFKKTQNSINA